MAAGLLERRGEIPGEDKMGDEGLEPPTFCV